MASIRSLVIRKVLDSRGNATVEVDVTADDAFGRAAAPSGASTGTHEVAPFPAGGVDKALAVFREEVAPRLVGQDAAAQADADRVLHEIDGTRNFERIGGNVAVAVSLAVAKAAANARGLPLYRYLGGDLPPRMPHPLGNVIGGGRHAIGGTTIQEFLSLARGPTASESVFANAGVHRAVRDLLRDRMKGQSLARGDEGAWVAAIPDEGALEVLQAACVKVSGETGVPCEPSLDLAASEFYRDGSYVYRDRKRTPEEQIGYVAELVDRFDLRIVEDPLHEEDFEGYARLTKDVGERCLVVGDDLFVTSVERLRKGIEVGAANAILIKPNQIGTLSDTMAAVDLAHRSGYSTVMSHRSGETTDAAIAHLAVAFRCYAIKTGAVGGERIAKLNELIRIEEEVSGRS